MAHKDYVARGRAQKQKQAPAPKKRLPWLRIIITFGLISGFSYFLYSIKDKAADIPEEPQTTSSKGEQAAELPKIPDEEWEFFELLPQQTVSVEEKEQVVSDKRYLMQCASFRVKDQAEEMKAKIAMQGLESQVRSSDGSNGRWYRVILGPYQLKRVAEKDRHTLQRSNINTCQIWFWNL